jgi:hypothetical protein
MNSITLYNNTFYRNYASIDSSIVKIELFLKVNITLDTYIENGNSFPNAIM